MPSTAVSLQRPLLLSVLAFAAALTLAPSAGAASDDPAFVVPVGATDGGFGAFRDSGLAPKATDAMGVFGLPSSTDPSDGGCALSWAALGIRATFTTFGQGGDDCTDGYFRQARLTDPRWHTASAIRVGSSQRRVRHYSKRTCRKSNCGATGHALGLFQSDCAAAKVPTVIATIRKGRVNALLVNQRGCE